MKKPEHIQEADLIGRDSYDLLNFIDLQDNASAKRQVAALQRDQLWQELHHNEVSSRLNKLIQTIENE